ncbi:hypothetical protein ACFCP7_22470 [Paenibacillus elgii]
MKKVSMGSCNVMDLGDYEVKSKTWIVYNDKDRIDVFNIHAPEWFKQWEHADDYTLGRALHRSVR